MKASFVDLRHKMKQIMKALDRNEPAIAPVKCGEKFFEGMALFMRGQVLQICFYC